MLRGQSRKLGSVVHQSHVFLNGRVKYEEEQNLLG